MFGFAAANPEKLSQESRRRYLGMYCGVCRAMGNRPAGALLSENEEVCRVGSGRIHRLALSYDLVLPALVLSAVTQTPFSERTVRCGAHPFKKRTVRENKYTLYAADMNLLLAYYRFLDDVRDEGGVTPKAQAAMFKKEALRLTQRYPALAREIEECLRLITEAEHRNETDYEIPADFFGELLGAVFAWFDLPCREQLYRFGHSLGKVIYYMDAAVDIQADLKKQRYNPLIRLNAAERTALLDLQLGDCMEKYADLPYEQDRDITDNILLSGVWTNYERERRRRMSFEERGGEADGAGSL